MSPGRKKFDVTCLPGRPDLAFEGTLWAQGIRLVAGIDEAGRGAWAGPVAAAAAVLPADPCIQQQLAGVRDSKEMTPDQRAYWAGRIRVFALDWAVGFASSQEIDCAGILPATRLAVRRALAGLSYPPQYLLVDYLVLPEADLPQTPLVKGDARSLSIAAASVLAKTARDALLCQLDAQYPGYHFAAHKGYGTSAHQRALQALGPCAIHRTSFEPVKKIK